MKKTLFFLFFALASMTVISAKPMIAIRASIPSCSADDKTQMEDAEDKLSLSLHLYHKGQEQQALDMLDKLIADAQSGKWENDSLYAMALTVKARCHNALNNTDKAIETVQQAIDVWHEHRDTLSKDYAVMLDNMAFYLSKTQQTAKAVTFGERSLAIYDQLLKNDYDKAIVLFHLAEACNDNKMSDKAVKYEKLALNILKNEYGEHSKKYVDELEYLGQYYRDADKNDEAKAVEERIAELKKEMDAGTTDIPDPIASDDPSVYRANTKDALFCAKYYLSHALSAPDMEKAALYIITWGSCCDDVTICVGKEETEFLQKDDWQLFCGFAYYAGCVKYAIEKKKRKFSLEMFKYGVENMVNFYMFQMNNFKLKKIPYLEKYVKAINNGDKDNIGKLIEENYEKLKASMTDSDNDIFE